MDVVVKDVKGYEDIYKVAEDGRIYSVKRVIEHRNRIITIGGKFLKSTPNNQGYHHVSLYLEGKSKTLKVHRIVAEAYIPNPSNKKEVNHKDFDKGNNAKSNLEWTTPKENTIHAIGRRSSDKLDDDKVREIRVLSSLGVSTSEVARRYKVSNIQIRRVIKREAWKHVK